MQLGNISKDQLLITSTIKCSDFKWLALIFADLEAIQHNNYVQDGSKLGHFIPSQEVIMPLTLKIKNLTHLDKLSSHQLKQTLNKDILSSNTFTLSLLPKEV